MKKISPFWLLIFAPVLQIALDPLNPDPAKLLMEVSGAWAIYFLLSSLAITPLKKWWNLVPHRRALGSMAGIWALLHMTAWFLFYGWDFKLFVIIGLIAASIMAALLVTSPFTIRRKMAPKVWKRLHQLVYPASILAITHVILDIRGDEPEAYVYAIVLAGLLAWRIYASINRSRRMSLSRPVAS